MRGAGTPAAANRPASACTASPTLWQRAIAIASGSGMALHRRELAGLVIGDERVDQLVERGPLEHLLELVQGEVDAVIGDAPLREVVRPDAFGASAGADRELARLSLGLVAVFLGLIYALYYYLVRRFDPFHVWLLTATSGVIVIAVVAAVSGVSMAVCLVILMLAPAVTVVGYEARGYRHQAESVSYQ